tara:strand:- start:6713 stop:7537 length:825 start_codon:yes stop_codon:yes gene_type:complete
MKVYIQSNKYQKIAAKVAAYSFERFGLKTEYLNFEDNKLLNYYLGSSYLRKGESCIFKDDLQSFTILRFLAPQINKFKEKILVIDPDVFAIKDPTHMINLISNFDIACTFRNNFPRSEVMIIDANKVNWKFEDICKKVFDKEIDYSKLIDLTFDKNLKLKKINDEYNSIDKVNNETILLHTSNRITQPWKEDLEINFERYNLKVKDYLKYYFKKIFNKNYNNNLFAKKFVKHPNDKVYATVKNLFNEAIKNNFIQNYEIEEAISKGYISKKILN